MFDKAIVTIRVFDTNKKGEYDLEIPLNISAYELFVALNESFDLIHQNLSSGILVLNIFYFFICSMG